MRHFADLRWLVAGLMQTDKQGAIAAWRHTKRGSGSARVSPTAAGYRANSLKTHASQYRPRAQRPGLPRHAPRRAVCGRGTRPLRPVRVRRPRVTFIQALPTLIEAREVRAKVGRRLGKERLHAPPAGRIRHVCPAAAVDRDVCESPLASRRI